MDSSACGAPLPRSQTCELCGVRVEDVSALQRHVVTSHSFTDLLARTAEGVFCAQCLLPFSNPGALAEHIKLVHTSTAAVTLATFSKLAKRPSSPVELPTDLSKKARTDLPSNELSSSTLLCSQCNAPFNNFESFRTHLKTHLDGQQGSASVVCPECKLALPSDVDLEGHLASHFLSVSTEYGCQACFKLFSKPDELQKHLIDIHAHHIYRCALCKEMFDSKVSIQVHFAVKHSNECKVKKCVKCSVSFHSQGEFELHIRSVHLRANATHSNSEGYRCLLCHLTVATEEELTSHLSTHQKQFQCNQCEEAFHVEFLLDKHIQSCHSREINGAVSSSRLIRDRLSPAGSEPLKCELCNFEASTDAGLVSHYQKVHTNKSVSGGLKVAAATVSLFCAYCNEACKSRSDLEAHVKMHQGNGGRHKCNICDELFPSASTLAHHKLSHIKALTGSNCNVCRENLTSTEQVSSHQKEHHPEPLPQPCVICRQTLLTSVELKVHAKFHGSQNSISPSYLNSYEDTYSKDRVTFNNNIEKVKHMMPLKCPLCFIKLETVEEAESHVCSASEFRRPLLQRTAPQTPCNSDFPQSYQCIKCQESFSSETEIAAHVSLHLQTEGSSHECHLCKAHLDSPLRLQCHLIEHTFEGCGSYTCYLCSAVFTAAQRLQQHMLQHGFNARPYDCHHCHLRFFFNAELENHLLSHSEEVKGKCVECSNSAQNGDLKSKGYSSSSLGIAQKVEYNTQKSPDTETKVKVYDGLQKQEEAKPADGAVVCSTCGRKCRNDASRKIHEVTHEGARPYICSRCSASFTRKCDAISHRKQHDNEDVKENKCCSCSESFLSATSLEEHVTEKHCTGQEVFVRCDSRCSSCSESEKSNGES